MSLTFVAAWIKVHGLSQCCSRVRRSGEIWSGHFEARLRSFCTSVRCDPTIKCCMQIRRRKAIPGILFKITPFLFLKLLVQVLKVLLPSGTEKCCISLFALSLFSNPYLHPMPFSIKDGSFQKQSMTSCFCLCTFSSKL